MLGGRGGEVGRVDLEEFSAVAREELHDAWRAWAFGRTCASACERERGTRARVRSRPASLRAATSYVVCGPLGISTGIEFGQSCRERIGLGGRKPGVWGP
jgi:hypothetical protein